MNVKTIWTIVSSLKLCIDKMWFVRWVTQRSLKTRDWLGLFFRFSPQILQGNFASSDPTEEHARNFSTAVSIFRFGNITKLTNPLRTVLANNEVLALGKLFALARVLEVGTSDGSAALPIYESKEFAKIIPTDRFNRFYSTNVGPLSVYLDADKKAFLAKLLFISFSISESTFALSDRLEIIETVNPVLRSRFNVRSIEKMNIFNDVLEEPVHIIKCSNLLNVEYFSSSDLIDGVKNLAKSLVDDGYIVISQNNEKYDGGEALFVLQKKRQQLVMIKNDNQHSVADLFSELEVCVA